MSLSCHLVFRSTHYKRHLTTCSMLRSTLNRNSENTRHLLITRAKKNLRGNMTCDQYSKVHTIICATFLGSAVYIYNSSQNGSLPRAGQAAQVPRLSGSESPIPQRIEVHIHTMYPWITYGVSGRPMADTQD